MTRWADVLPPATAKKQCAWEHRQRVLRVQEAGWSYGAIGDHLGISKQARDRLRKVFGIELP